jgi:fatty acid desaturase
MSTPAPTPPSSEEVRSALDAARARGAPGARGVVLASMATCCAAPLIAPSIPTATPLLAVLASFGFLQASIALHECAHGSLFGSRSANAALGAALGVWLLSPFGGYRRGHRAHHKWAGTPKDPTRAPQDEIPERRWLTWLLRLRIVPVFYWAGVYLPYLTYDVRSRDHLVSWTLSVLATLTLHGALTWWLGPLYLVTCLLAFWGHGVLYDHLFSTNQHLGLQAIPVDKERYSTREQVNFSRTTSMPGAAWLFHFNLHKEHHLAPGEPFYVLPALHEELSRLRPDLYAFTDDSLRWHVRHQHTSHELLSPRPGDLERP